MARPIVVLLASVASLFATPSLRADPPSANERALTREIVELKSQIESLRAEIKALRSLVQAWSDRQVVPYAELRFAPEAVPANPTVPAPSRDAMPEGTVRKQFNGSPLYVIPLAGDRPATADR